MEVVDLSEHAGALLAAAANKLIWHVGYGGGAGATFSLSMGDRIARGVPLKSDGDPIFQRYQGEFAVYAWAPWTLRTATAFFRSDVDEHVAELEILRGSRLASLTVTSGGELHIVADGVEVSVTAASEIDDAWELVTPAGELVMTTRGQLIELPADARG